MSIASLGYLGFKASNLDAWSTFATEILGLMKVPSPEGGLRFRADALAWRIAIDEGPEDDLGYLGFQVAGPAELAALSAKLSAAGVEVASAEPPLLAERGVLGLFSCQDPEGLRIEVYYGPTEVGQEVFVSPAGVSAFLTGEQGIGHVVISARDIAATRAFYQDLLGFRLSDIIEMKVSPEFTLGLEFYHCNPRHHTLALLPVPTPKRLNHFMLQATSLDDVGFALDRATAAGAPIAMSLGKHTNDQMVSFYAVTPSGFQVEFGWGGLEVDDASWWVVRHTKTSTWGHKRPAS
ncbi:VOC family protein [Phenylobacterium sp.]|uniref:VOC family protein n=1 Tax=Phenylobacterium sp. TaxID=1871053 RepID=UPI0035B15021